MQRSGLCARGRDRRRPCRIVLLGRPMGKGTFHMGGQRRSSAHGGDSPRSLARWRRDAPALSPAQVLPHRRRSDPPGGRAVGRRPPALQRRSPGESGDGDGGAQVRQRTTQVRQGSSRSSTPRGGGCQRRRPPPAARFGSWACRPKRFVAALRIELFSHRRRHPSRSGHPAPGAWSDHPRRASGRRCTVAGPGASVLQPAPGTDGGAGRSPAESAASRATSPRCRCRLPHRRLADMGSPDREAPTVTAEAGAMRGRTRPRRPASTSVPAATWAGARRIPGWSGAGRAPGRCQKADGDGPVVAGCCNATATPERCPTTRDPHQGRLARSEVREPPTS